MSIQPEIIEKESKQGDNATKIRTSAGIYLLIIFSFLAFVFIFNFVVRITLILLGLVFVFRFIRFNFVKSQ